MDTTNAELLELCQSLNADLAGHPEASRLRLELEDFSLNEKETGDEGEFFYFDGKVRGTKDFLRSMRSFVESVDVDVKAMFPSGESHAVTYLSKGTPAIRKFDSMPLSVYFDSKASTTEKRVLDTLRRAYMTEMGGELENQSALNFLLLADTDVTDGEYTWYGASDEAMRVKGGNERIIKALLAFLETRKDLVRIELGHKIVDLSTNGSQLTVGFDARREVKTKRVVCCLPFSTLRDLGRARLRALGIKETKLQSIMNFSYGTNSKHMLGFSERTWREPRGDFPKWIGSAITDLPIGMFWETSRLQTDFLKSGILTNFLGGKEGMNARPEDASRIVADLRKMFPRLPDPIASTLQAWPQLPWSKGSYSSPAPGAYTTYIGVEREPELDGRLLFAGEHTSYDWMGYMNGAVKTANLGAARIVGFDAFLWRGRR